MPLYVKAKIPDYSGNQTLAGINLHLIYLPKTDFSYLPVINYASSHDIVLSSLTEKALIIELDYKL